MRKSDSHSAQERRVRRLAARVGYRVHKGRGAEHANNCGLYQLVNDRNLVVLGVDFDASLDEVERHIRGPGAAL